MPADIASSSTGYLHPAYADALSEYGQPVSLPNCGGWVLERRIPGEMAVDAMGCYPLFACVDWNALSRDIRDMGRDWISLALVADPFGDYTVDQLRSCFPDVMIPFKQHYVVDLSKSPRDFIADHHARNARKALQMVTVETCQDPLMFLEDWIRLYTVLIQRHQIRGIATFSRQSFVQQLQVPGLQVLRASVNGETVGMLVWYIMNDRVYYHLGAYSQFGYELRASFGLFSFAIDYFSDIGLKWLNLGAGAGTKEAASNGLNRFKSGWSTDTRTAFFCGRILDKARYHQLAFRQMDLHDVSYFPLYRYGEF